MIEIKNFEQRADYKQVTCLRADFSEEIDKLYQEYKFAGLVIKTNIDTTGGMIDKEELDKKIENYAIRTHKVIYELEREKAWKNEVIDQLIESEKKREIMAGLLSSE